MIQRVFLPASIAIAFVHRHAFEDRKSANNLISADRDSLRPNGRRFQAKIASEYAAEQLAPTAGDLQATEELAICPHFQGFTYW